MKLVTYIEVSEKEVLQALEEKYNRDNNTNHQLGWYGLNSTSNITVRVVKHNKEEETH